MRAWLAMGSSARLAAAFAVVALGGVACGGGVRGTPAATGGGATSAGSGGGACAMSCKAAVAHGSQVCTGAPDAAAIYGFLAGCVSANCPACPSLDAEIAACSYCFMTVCQGYYASCKNGQYPTGGGLCAELGTACSDDVPCCEDDPECECGECSCINGVCGLGGFGGGVSSTGGAGGAGGGGATGADGGA